MPTSHTVCRTGMTVTVTILPTTTGIVVRTVTSRHPSRRRNAQGSAQA